MIVVKRSAEELVVIKPAGLASELRDPEAESVITLAARMVPGSTPKLPHRLDRVTRGIVVVCLSQASIAFHNAQIAARRWDKYYLARVAPHEVDPSALVGPHRVFLKEASGRARLVKSGGKPAWLEILAVAPTPDRADRWHALIHLQTGRFHQIRVMCAALGLPLVGDPLYDPERRDEREFYLEHALLRYTDYDTQALATIFARDDAERGPIAPTLMAELEQIAAQPELSVSA